jgi:hypothetical protein
MLSHKQPSTWKAGDNSAKNRRNSWYLSRRVPATCSRQEIKNPPIKPELSTGESYVKFTTLLAYVFLKSYSKIASYLVANLYQFNYRYFHFTIFGNVSMIRLAAVVVFGNANFIRNVFANVGDYFFVVAMGFAIPCTSDTSGANHKNSSGDQSFDCVTNVHDFSPCKLE